MDIIGAAGILTSGKLCHIPNKLLPEINQRLCQPIETALKRPSQKSYAPIHGLYLLLRTTGLVLVIGQGKSQKLVLNQEILPSWQQLNPTERYFTLLEAWLVNSYGDILGESNIEINSGTPDGGKGWRIKSIEVLPWGKAIMEWFDELYMAKFLFFESEKEIKESRIVQPLLSYYFPEWQQI